MRSAVLTVLFSLMALSAIDGQSDPLSGSYSGYYNGDNLSLVLEGTAPNTYSGVMKDSQQTYAIELKKAGRNVHGSATENSIGLVLAITGVHETNTLLLTFDIDIAGAHSSMEINFTKQGSPVNGNQVRVDQTETIAQNNSIAALPNGAANPSQVVGTWQKEELYQSGYGDNSLSAGFSQRITFFADGSVSDGGSSASISGSNYSGQSSGRSQHLVPGVTWYTIDNQLYILANENGVTQTLHLGKFYIENGNMLITGTNGEKMLLSRVD